MTGGPYMNEDGDWWVAVEDMSFREARKTIINCLYYDVPHDGRLAYLGKETTTLCDVPDHIVGPDCSAVCARRVLAYHFEERGQR